MTDSIIPAPSDLALAVVGPADRNPARVYLASLAPGSVAAQVSALESIASMVLPGSTLDTFPWARLRYQHTAAIRSRLAALHAPATVNRMLCAMRRVLKEAWRLNLVPAEEYHRARDVDAVKGERLPAGRMLSQQELAALFGACDPDMPIDARNAAALAVMYGCGLRRQELSRLLLSDLREGDEPALRVLGKRNKERLVPVPDGARPHLAAWLRHRGRHPGRLFLRINGTVLGDPRRRRGEAWTDRDGISGKAVLDLLAAMARQAGVVSCTPHDLRRTYVSTLLQQGADLSVAQHLAGHDDAKTTARYDRRGEVAARRAAALLPWPSAHPAPTQPPGPAGGHPTGGAR